MKRFLGCILVVACGEVKNDLDTDGPVLPDSPIDMSPAPRCSPTAPYTSTSLVAEISSPGRDDQVTLSSDELELYLTRFTGPGTAVILRSQRAAISDPWSTPQEVAAINAHDTQRADSLSADGLSLYLSAADSGLSDQLLVATRTSTAADFGPPSLLANINSANGELWGIVDPDNLGMYFSSNRDGALRLYRTERASTAVAFGDPEIVDAPPDLYLPIVTDDGLGLYYTVLASGDFYSSRGATTDPFPASPTDLDSPGGWLSWISPDHCRAYYAVELPDGPGDIDIHFAVREPIESP